MYGLDNWVYSAAYGKRFRDAGSGPAVGSKWLSDVIPIGGQFGITQDDVGRQFFNTNSNYFRGNLVPPQYTIRNPHYRGSGANVEIDHDQACWPAHPAAVNRGYRAHWLRDGRLREFTAACSPCIYRGGLFGAEYEGNAFVCEPTSNFVRRSIVSSPDGVTLTAKNAYDRHEFLTSTNERFRPVNLYTGPDGALYVVDMAHGILQHRLSLTAYLRNKYHKRELDQHLMDGRIFRIYPEGATLYPRKDLRKAKSSELVELLAHPNGWWRDTAQRLLVERNDSSIAPRLKALLKNSDSPVARIHALWTLEGMRRFDPSAARAALGDRDPEVRAMAIRAAEPLLYSPLRTAILPDVLKLADDPAPRVRLQFALTVSEIGTPEADAALARLLATGDDLYTRDGAVSGMRGRELEFLQRLLADAAWADRTRGRTEMLAALANAVTAEGNPRRVDRLLTAMAAQTDALAWRRAAMAKGVTEVATARPKRRPIMFAAEPAALASLAGSLDPAAAAHFVWPGKPGYVPPPPPVPLTPEQQATFEVGRQVYATVCVQCHKPDGMGLTGLAPPLVGSEWVLGPEQRVVRIVLSGLRGPVTVNGDSFNLDMPSLAALSDQQIAGALTFVRRSWDNGADPVDPRTVARIRAETHGRLEAWTERDLLKLNLPAGPAHPQAPPPAAPRAGRATPSTSPAAGG
jgi:mono/diheme cytochrome c family protein